MSHICHRAFPPPICACTLPCCPAVPERTWKNTERSSSEDESLCYIYDHSSDAPTLLRGARELPHLFANVAGRLTVFVICSTCVCIERRVWPRGMSTLQCNGVLRNCVRRWVIMNSIGGVNVVVWVLEINCLGRRVRRIDSWGLVRVIMQIVVES